MLQKFRTVIVFTKISTKRFFRDKTAIFFTIAFPLIFLFVFGGIFGKEGAVSFNVSLINNSKSSFAKKFAENANKGTVIKVNQDVRSLEDARELMNKGELDATIVLPESFGVVSDQSGSMIPTGQAEVIYSQNNQQAAQTLSSVLQAQFQEINEGLVDSRAPFTVKTEQTNQRGLSSFDYIFSGLLGFSIIGIGVYSDQ